jgi:hypothetical protein
MAVVETVAVNALVARSTVTVPVPVAALEFGGVSCAPDNEAVKFGTICPRISPFGKATL